jgi:putative thiamine transport system permease protein
VKQRPGWAAFFPLATLAVFLLPIAAGLLGTLLPAFGYLPALGGGELSLEPWRDLLAAPGLAAAVRLSLTSGFGATLIALLLTLAFLAAFHGRWPLRQAQRLVAPLLAMPHAAFAIGLAFLLAPSGFLVRLISPWLTGWERPPDLLLIQDPLGLAMMLALAVKEVPFLLLLALAALNHLPAAATLATARTLGYAPASAWFRFLLPQLYPALRLPVYAVLAYGLSQVEIGLILGPTTPPPLAPLVLRWFADPDLARRFQGAAGAVMQLGIVAAGLILWRLGEAAVATVGRRALLRARRGRGERPLRLAAGAGMALSLGLAAAALLLLLLWSVAEVWRFPAALPERWSLAAATARLDTIGPAFRTTLLAGLAAALVALVLVLGCLEHESRAQLRVGRRALALLYLPLLVPQVAFLFGLQVLLLLSRLEGTWVALVLAHLVFVLPYVFLSLSEPFRALDPRLIASARTLGLSRWRVFVEVKLPVLLRPLLAAFAVGFAVSVGLYLPTLFAGAGRLTTLTTEAVALASGADRRLTALFALLQALLPLAGFWLALWLPRFVWRRRRDLALA